VSIQRLQSHWGFTRMPFGRDLAPGMLHRYLGHGEAVARISWCVDQCAIGVITGEVGPGSHCWFPFLVCLIRSRLGPNAALLVVVMVAWASSSYLGMVVAQSM
jgi:hypothetical protein